jgi:putative ABC transport system substrate-binding protein
MTAFAATHRLGRDWTTTDKGGNLTGVTLDAGIEIWGKRLEMLKEAIPSATKAAFLGMRGGWQGSSEQVLREAGDRLGISLVLMLPEKGTPCGD